MTGVFYHSVIHGLGFFICFNNNNENLENFSSLSIEEVCKIENLPMPHVGWI